jgi:twinkle protein
MALRDELGRRFGFDRCLKVDCPPDCKDANDVLLKYGNAKLVELIKSASEFPIEGVFGIDELYEDIKSFYYNGYPKGVKVGIPSFDEHIQFMSGQFTTVTGIPGSGKSEFVDYIMAQTAINHKWTWGVCSFENQPSSFHVTKLMEKYVGKSFAQRYNPYDRMNSNEFDDAVNFVGDYFHFINVNAIDVTLQGILDKAKELVTRKGIQGLLIDPWNYVEHKSASGQTETQYVSECLTKIKAFALTHGIHILLIAHPTKLGKINNKYEVPTLYNISGSAHFFNKTDNGITVYRDFATNKVDIHIQKVRYSWLGKVGMCSFSYDTNTRQYKALDNEQASPL